MRKLAFNLSLACALSLSAVAAPDLALARMGDASAGSANAKSGIATPIKGFGNCNNPTYYGISGLASHGKITVKEVKQKACGRNDFPVTVVVYTSEPGFVGDDTINLYVANGTLWITVHVEK